MYRSLVLSLAVAACAVTPKPDADDGCNPPAGSEAVASAAEGGFLVVGEMHGTKEVPVAFGRYVCAAAERGGRTLVGLEIDPAHQPVLDAARQSTDPRAVLLDGMADHWSSPDGRGSEAMLDLVVYLSGLDGLTVHAFDAPLEVPDFGTEEETQAWFLGLSPGERQQMREERMSDSLSKAFGGHDRAIVLVGNIHAAETRFEFLEGADNMAMLLPSDPITLDNRHDRGTAWNMTDSVGRANPAGTNKGGVPADAEAPAIGLTDAVGPRYDGYLYVGPITASPPAIRD